MRTSLATLTLTLVLSLAGLASADVYKCPAPGGTTVYQDAPCNIETAPVLRSEPETPSIQTRAPLPADPQAMQHALRCASFGDSAANIARARNSGVSRGRVIGPIQRLARDATELQFWTTMVDTLYQSDTITPQQASALALQTCLDSRP